MNRSSRLFAQLRVGRNALHRWRRGPRHVYGTAYVRRSARGSKDVLIAEYGLVGPGCQIVDPMVSIVRYAMASDVAVIGDDHQTDLPGVPTQFSGRPEQTATRIGHDAWIRYRAIIRRGVRIGRGAIVGVNSVVTRDVESYEIVAGAPARRVGWRFSDPVEVRTHDTMLTGGAVSPSFADQLDVVAEGTRK